MCENPFKNDLDELFGRLTIQKGLLYLLESQIKQIKHKTNVIVEEKNSTNIRLFLGTASCLAFTDLTGPTDNGWEYSYTPNIRFSAFNEKCIEELDHLLSRNAGYSIAQTYEAFETYIKNITARYLHMNPEKANRTKLEKYCGGISKKVDFGFWVGFVNTNKGKNNKEIFKLLRGFDSEIGKVEDQHKLKSWYKVISTVRHAITHSDFIVKKDKYDYLDNNAKEMLNNAFSVNNNDGEKKLIPECKQANKCIKTFCDYAFMIYKLLSIKDKYNWNYWNIREP